jgi:DNA-binding PadR family transcriptional regulator
MMLDKQLIKGTIPLLILRLCAQRDMYGYQLIKAMDEGSGGVFRFSEGTLYPVLHSLEKERQLKAYWQDMGGRKRKYYQLTDAGRAAYQHRLEQWTTFAAAIDAVLAKEAPDV